MHRPYTRSGVVGDVDSLADALTTRNSFITPSVQSQGTGSQRMTVPMTSSDLAVQGARQFYGTSTPSLLYPRTYRASAS